MTKKLLWALVLIGLTVIVLLMNGRGSASVNLLVADVSAARSLVYLGFTAIGVAIGVLLK